MTLKERYAGVIDYFIKNVPVAETELNYSNPFELIVAVILSAQCTDKRINQVTPKLFKHFPNAETLAEASPDAVFSLIRSVSYPNNKAKHLVNMANMLLKDFGGVIPSDITQLVKLPGVGRKTANVVASVIYDKPAMAVDTHVFRVANRLGLTKAKNPLQSELQLIKHIPEQYIASAHHWLILHGRYVCIARTPKCEICPLTKWCLFYVKSLVFANEKNISTANNIQMNKKISDKTPHLLQKKATTKTSAKGSPRPTPSSKKFQAHSTSLKVGDKAPAFSGRDQNGKVISLKELKGNNVVLYFYPKDNTPTCTLEACSLRDEHQFLSKKNYTVIGVSADDEKTHLKFASKFELPFSLIADTDMSIIKAYDVWGTKQFMGRIYDGIIRTTFIINPKGIISHIITDVKSKEHGKQILNLN
ncbi:MAG: nth [Bacteroidota bacterium]|jgi:endonuclease-3|nr:nth [Bacteroidota bacterium]